MLAVFVRNSKIVQSTGMSFAVLGTTMHMLNVANLMTPALSHTWSAIAIAGFFMTAGRQGAGRDDAFDKQQATQRQQQLSCIAQRRATQQQQ